MCMALFVSRQASHQAVCCRQQDAQGIRLTSALAEVPIAALPETSGRSAFPEAVRDRSVGSAAVLQALLASCRALSGACCRSAGRTMHSAEASLQAEVDDSAMPGDLTLPKCICGP